MRRRQRTFRAAAESHVANQKTGWSNGKHIQQWSNTLKTYVYPKIGDKPVQSVAPRLSVFRKDGAGWLIVAHANFAQIG